MVCACLPHKMLPWYYYTSTGIANMVSNTERGREIHLRCWSEYYKSGIAILLGGINFILARMILCTYQNTSIDTQGILLTL